MNKMNHVMRNLELEKVEELFIASNVTYGIVLISLGVIIYYEIGRYCKKKQ